ncbi:hypothetical protein ACFO4N_13000 [Camelliibacillus cellulosilyticus]|uniref:Uncharacterized protein n=1 Tax=Camelliibacillus cellulosilyticus TaxID=2174486 RepID=A0ABV9GNT3_9BACL
MKKVWLMVVALALVCTTAFSLFHNQTVKADEDNSGLKKKIERFYNVDSGELHIEAIEKQITLDDQSKVVLFSNKKSGVGYALFKNGKLKYVVNGDNRFGYEQIQGTPYFIVYGKKPKPSYTKLHLTINVGGAEDLQRTVNLGRDSFYLKSQKLPKGVKVSRVYTENYVYK